jgi:predicted DCC family thiol-disulfide oxidoreductase YuxK
MNTASVTFPLTLYYDASCPACRSEMHALKACDRHDRLILVDCSSAGFSDASAAAAGVTREAMLGAMHARDADGRWLTGVAVFAHAYAVAGLPMAARLWGHPRLQPVWARAYPWIARHRQLLSRLGAHHVLRVLILAFGASAGAPSPCASGGCRAATAPGAPTEPS